MEIPRLEIFSASTGSCTTIWYKNKAELRVTVKDGWAGDEAREPGRHFEMNGVLRDAVPRGTLVKLN